MGIIKVIAVMISSVLSIAFTLVIANAQANDEAFRAAYGDIKVSAKLNPASIETLMYVFDLTVSYEKDSFASTTVICQVNSKKQAIEVLRNNLGWKGDYFFVRLECGGGNAWRCDRLSCAFDKTT